MGHFQENNFHTKKDVTNKCELETQRYHCKDPHLRIAEPENEEEEKDVVVGTYRFEPSQSKRGLTKYLCIDVHIYYIVY